jgi:hypothetical protein
MSKDISSNEFVRIACIVLVGVGVALGVSPALAGFFSWAAMNGDSDTGISTDKTYTAAANIVGSDVTINGVLFTGSGTTVPGCQSGTGWSVDAPYPVTGTGAENVAGNVGSLVGDFLCYGDTQAASVLTISGLTTGQSYVATLYGKGWNNVGDRNQLVVASDSSSTYFDQNYTGDGNGNMLHFAYTASGSTMTLSFTPQVANGLEWNSFHFYGFSNEVAIPEPGTIVLLSTGILGLLAYAWRKRK